MKFLREGSIPVAVQVQGIKFPVGLTPAHQKVGGAIAGKVPEIHEKDLALSAGQGIAGPPAAVGFIQNLQVDQWLILHGVKDNGFLLFIAVQIGENVGGAVAAAGGVAQSQLLADHIPQGFIHLGLQLGKDGRREEGIDIGLVKIAAGKAQQQAGPQGQSTDELFHGGSSFPAIWVQTPNLPSSIVVFFQQPVNERGVNSAGRKRKIFYEKEAGISGGNCVSRVCAQAGACMRAREGLS